MIGIWYFMYRYCIYMYVVLVLGYFWDSDTSIWDCIWTVMDLLRADSSVISWIGIYV